MRANPKEHIRFLICGLVLILSLTALSYRVISLQWLPADNTQIAQKKPHFKTEYMPAKRGLIVDRDGKPLVANIALNDLYIDRYHLDDENLISWGVACKQLSDTPKWIQASSKERKKMLTERRFYLLNNELPRELIAEHKSFVVGLLANPLKMDKAKLLEALNDPKRKSYRIAKDLPETEASYIDKILEEHYIFGLEFKKRHSRHYHSPTLATHIIGFTGKGKDEKNIGIDGIEKHYNNHLKGVDGYYRRRSNPNNLSIYSEEAEILHPESGFDVVLSIDTTLQSIVEEELDAGLAFAKAKKGCVVLIQPETGEILAMASRPHFNLNSKEGIAEGSSSYIFRNAIEPGSTIKVLTVAAGLNEGHINTRTMINCHNGFFKEGRVTVKDDYPKAQLSVTEILAISNNIGTYKIGRQVGRKRHEHYLKLFGIGTPTGLNWPGEAKTKGKAGSSPQDFAASTFGYAISVTPMHMALAYSAIANDGMMMHPILVKEVLTNEWIAVEKSPPSESHRVIKADVAKSLRRALASVTEEGGTGTDAAVEGYKVAGKTGTSLKWDKGYDENRVICSFGGMMPADDPKIVCYVVVDEPQTNEVGRYGGTLAGPIFSNVARRAALHMNIAPTE